MTKEEIEACNIVLMLSLGIINSQTGKMLSYDGDEYNVLEIDMETDYFYNSYSNLDDALTDFNS